MLRSIREEYKTLFGDDPAKVRFLGAIVVNNQGQC